MTDAPHAVLITGAAQRLGNYNALYLAERGYDILIHYNRSNDAAEALKHDIIASGGKAEILQADLSKASHYEHIITEAKNAMPNLSILVHNASIFEQANFLETDEAMFDKHFDLHVKAPFFLSQAFARHIGKGQIISMVDTFITKHSSSYFTYLLSKKTLAELTRMLARELAPDIRVNAVAPGPILPSGEQFGEAFLQRRAAMLPMQQTGTQEEVAKALHTLITHEFLTGHTLYVDGGEQLL